MLCGQGTSSVLRPRASRQHTLSSGTQTLPTHAIVRSAKACAGNPGSASAVPGQSRPPHGQASPLRQAARPSLTVRFRPDDAPASTEEALSPAMKAVQGTTMPVVFRLGRKCTYGERYAVCGNAPEIGAWDPIKAKPMKWTKGDVWVAAVPLPVNNTVEFKFICQNAASGALLRWEDAAAPNSSLRVEPGAAFMHGFGVEVQSDMTPDLAHLAGVPLGEPNLTPSATEVKEPPSADLLAHGRAVMELLERTARTATSPGTDSATSDTSNTTGIITGLTEDSATGMAIKATDWKSLPGSAPDTPLSNSPGAAFHAMDVAAEPAAASAELPLPMAMPKAATAAAVDESDPLAANPMDSNAPGVVGTAADPDLCPELGTCDNGNGAESVTFAEDIINAPAAANATAHSTVVSDLGAVGPAALAHDTIPETGVAPVTTPVVPPTGAGDVGEPPLAAEALPAVVTDRISDNTPFPIYGIATYGNSDVPHADSAMRVMHDATKGLNGNGIGSSNGAGALYASPGTPTTPAAAATIPQPTPPAPAPAKSSGGMLSKLANALKPRLPKVMAGPTFFPDANTPSGLPPSAHTATTSTAPAAAAPVLPTPTGSAPLTVPSAAAVSKEAGTGATVGDESLIEGGSEVSAETGMGPNELMPPGPLV